MCKRFPTVAVTLDSGDSATIGRCGIPLGPMVPKRDRRRGYFFVGRDGTKSLQAEERIELRGFGSFQVREKKARQGCNPKTGAVVEIAARKAVGFQPSKELIQHAGKPPVLAE